MLICQCSPHAKAESFRSTRWDKPSFFATRQTRSRTLPRAFCHPLALCLLAIVMLIQWQRWGVGGLKQSSKIKEQVSSKSRSRYPSVVASLLDAIACAA